MGKKNILIAGSNGMLGRDIVKRFIANNSYNVHGINRHLNKRSNIKEYTCDLTNFAETKKILKQINPDIIINCAANIDLDLCEDNKDYTYIINAESAAILASYNPLKTKYIYISTDSVFDGIKGNYKEGDKTNPLNYYAYTKLEGERLSLEQNLNSIIIRTNIYGFNIPQKKTLAEWALSNLISNNRINGFDDVYFNPVYTKQLAELCHQIINTNFKGLINVGCTQKLSKYEFLIKLANQFNINTNLIDCMSVENMNSKIERPKNTTLNTSVIKQTMNIEFDIDDGIKCLYEDYIKE